MTFTVNRFREQRSRSGTRYWNSTKADCVDDRQRNAAYTCMITSGMGFVLAMAAMAISLHVHVYRFCVWVYMRSLASTHLFAIIL